MNDTHGETGKGWIGFDLDGTLAKYDGWNGIDHIGEPIGPMVSLIKMLHAEGKTVKILTARVAPKEKPEVKPNPYLENHWVIESPDDMPWAVHAEVWTPREFIQDWCYRFLGFVPEIVYQKDHLMLDLYDDRCHQVIPNTGVIVEETAKEWKKQAYYLLNTVEEMNADALSIRWIQRIMCACIGVMIALLVSVGCEVWLHHRSERNDPEVELRDALNRYLETKAHEQVSEAVGRLLP